MTNQAAYRLSRQMDKIMKNRTRRFKFLVKQEQLDDAFAIADEFFEWLSPEHEDDDELIVYYNEEELQALYEEKISKGH
jgi:hypothetical protein